ncbi:MAG: hypothetical protein SFW67_13315 [Myxococcaceae bacterium]|nr:hypothetical protein [Myxococcaceae bacterium]
MLRPLAGLELRLTLAKLGPMNPGLAQVWRTPERSEGVQGEPFTVLGSNGSSLWFALAEDGSVHLVDDVERELGARIFPTVDAFAEELRRQNGR